MNAEPEWYYIGQYGELGPLELDQMLDLIQDRVVMNDTYVWRRGMTDWVKASEVKELRGRISAEMQSPPPPPPTATPPRAPQPSSAPVYAPQITSGGHSSYGQPIGTWGAVESYLPRSDKNRVTAGLLNLIPGVGRLYLGYSAHGVLQILTTVFCGVGLIWSVIDAVYILLGGVKYDGYGRVLND